MTNTIFTAQVLNRYRAPGWRYSPIRGHTGVDLKFKTGDSLNSPVSGSVIAVSSQHEMGICIYILDALGNCHVFAHLQQVNVVLHQTIKRGDFIATTDNTGTATSGPHLHYEIMTKSPVNFIDKIMYRKELASIFKGYNTDPIPYLKWLYGKFFVDWQTGKDTSFRPVPHNPNGF